MKSNFVVSAFRPIWLQDSKKLFAIDPYIQHVLECGAERCSNISVETAPVKSLSQGELAQEHDFVGQRFQRYSKLLADRLDELHESNHGRNFWKKTFSLSILRHVTFCYDLFQVCETNLNPDVHDCRILDPAAFRIPCDFDEHRSYFQHTDIGREQLFSIYCSLFHPGIFCLFDANKVEGARAKIDDTTAPATRNVGVRFLSLWRKIWRTKSDLFKVRSPKIGLLQTSISARNIEILERRSWGGIRQLQMPVVVPMGAAIRYEDRDKLTRDDPSFDRFDRFVFASLHHAMPTMLVEDFSGEYARYKAHFAPYDRLTWIVSEWWIGHSRTAFALAVLSERGIKHIYNEHNYISHPWVGSSFKYLASLVDEFATIGWGAEAIPNVIRGASLFPWEAAKPDGVDNDILLILGVPFVSREEINAVYATSGAALSLAYIGMTKRFLEQLDSRTLSRTYIRSYPQRDMSSWLVWDQEAMLKDCFSAAKVVDKGRQVSAKALIKRSRLVVINYVATSFLESLVANVPTILLFNANAYFLAEEYSSFFDDLIAAGICQTDPVAAAEFINVMWENPDKWWGSEEVQGARQRFLSSNLAPPQIMIDHLLQKASS